MIRKILLLIPLFTFGIAHAELMDELDPRSLDIEDTLRQMDEEYEEATGLSPWIDHPSLNELANDSHTNDSHSGEGFDATACYRATCPVWVRVNLKEQLFYLYEKGVLTQTWITSTGRTGFVTPKMERNPTGRIYDAYSSKIYPGGDYQGLGNMPYAVFILGGYAIHGTPKDNWGDLGSPVSGGCIRLLPENGKIFNRLVRLNGRRAVWVSVETG